VETSLTIKPIKPISAMPRKQIFIESQSSLLPGFVANLSSLFEAERNDLNPMVYLSKTQQ
jgi:hypothetical protein